MTTLQILIIDDHPSQIDGYKSILSFNEMYPNINFTSCSNCRQAYELITNPALNTIFSLTIIDYNIPPFTEKEIKNGEDLALVIKEYLPNTKIVMITSHTEAIVLYNVLKRVNPDGLLVKSDFDGEELLQAFIELMNGNQYYSETVKQSKKVLISHKDLLDSTNRQIIELLAQGIKTKNLPDYLYLSKSAIEKRKSIIKDALGVQKGGDEEILFAARRIGLI